MISQAEGHETLVTGKWVCQTQNWIAEYFKAPGISMMYNILFDWLTGFQLINCVKQAEQRFVIKQAFIKT